LQKVGFVPFTAIDRRIIYFLVLDVCEYSASASKRGTLKTHAIDETEIRTVVREHATTAAAAPAEVSAGRGGPVGSATPTQD
jgi:hypothetical protein